MFGVHVHSSRALRGLAGLAIALACAALASACAGGNASRVSGERRFEHCYRLDDDATIPEGEKLDCWRAWSARDGGRDAPEGTRARYARDRLHPSPATAPSGSER